MQPTNQNGSYAVYDKSIPDDNYEVTSVIQNSDGTQITLQGKENTVTVSFGCVECLCVCDEGRRIESYNRIEGIKSYRKNCFFGNPLYVAKDTDFLRWLNFESCTFSQKDAHYAVITVNDFIDIAAVFPPKILVNGKN
ncbi:MAG: hypothetical protein LUD27_09095 [Clostridia bacterium]|nr:hypothetical protein [Clostridia bacterium]